MEQQIFAQGESMGSNCRGRVDIKGGHATRTKFQERRRHRRRAGVKTKRHRPDYCFLRVTREHGSTDPCQKNHSLWEAQLLTVFTRGSVSFAPSVRAFGFCIQHPMGWKLKHFAFNHRQLALKSRLWSQPLNLKMQISSGSIRRV